MRRKSILLGIAGILLLVPFGWNLLADAKDQRQEVILGQGYKMGDVLLKPGKYVIVHRHKGEKEGLEACTFLYRGTSLSEKDLVTSLRCKPSEAPVAKDFILKGTRQPDGTTLVTSIQFPGSRDVHNF